MSDSLGIRVSGGFSASGVEEIPEIVIDNYGFIDAEDEAVTTNSARNIEVYNHAGATMFGGIQTSAIDTALVSLNADGTFSDSVVMLDEATLLDPTNTAVNTLELTGPSVASGNLRPLDTVSGVDRLEVTGGTWDLTGSTVLDEYSRVFSGAVAILDDVTLDTPSSTIDEGGIIQANGDVQFGGSSYTGALFNYGTLDLSGGNSVVATTVTATGDYTAGSNLIIDTILNDGGTTNAQPNDASFTDQLIVGGDVSGVTDVFINNTGGTGASTDLNLNNTVDANEGILFAQGFGDASLDVDDGIITFAENFVLGAAANTTTNLDTSRETIIEGSFAYDIYAIDPSASGNENGTWDWVLASQLAPSTVLYDPWILSVLNDLPSLEQRVGNRHWEQVAQPAAPLPPVYVFCKEPGQNYRCLVTDDHALVYADTVPAAGGVTIEGGAAWVHLDVAREHLEPVFSSTNSTYDIDTAGIQMGVDRLLRENADGDRLIGGVNLRYGTAYTDVTSALGNGTVDTTGYGLGATLTWYEQNGLYVDGQAQVMWFDTDLASSTLGQTLVSSHEGFGYALSVEVGKRIAVNEHWRVTPQVQLSYAHTEQDTFTDPFGAVVTPADAESVKLRFGMVASYEDSWREEDGTISRKSFNVGAHVIKEFEPETSVDVSGTVLTSKRDDLTGQITLGGTYNWDDDANSVYAQVAASTGLDNFGNSHRVGVTTGYRRQWK